MKIIISIRLALLCMLMTFGIANGTINTWYNPLDITSPLSGSFTINNNDSMIFNIDADNSSTSNFFRFATNTTLETGGTELMRITEGGSVQIGNTYSGTAKLYLVGTNATSTDQIIIGKNSAGGDLFVIRNDGLFYTGTAALSPYNYGVSGGVALYVGSSGQLGYNSSTRQSKTNIVNIENVEWLKKLTPVNFNKRKVDDDNNYLDEFESELEYGLIAEDVQEVNNDMVFSTNDGKLKGVHYDKLIVPILKLVQEQQAQIEELKKLVATK